MPCASPRLLPAPVAQQAGLSLSSAHGPACGLCSQAQGPPSLGLCASAPAKIPLMETCSFPSPLGPSAYLHGTHALFGLSPCFTYSWIGGVVNLKPDAEGECVCDLLMGKFYMWINVQELVKRREKKRKSDIIVFRLCFGVCTINSESYLRQDIKLFLAYDGSILLSFCNP